MNPLGIQAEATSTEGQSDDYSYDTLWRAEGRITADGYAVLIAIPFRSLRFSSANVQTWGIGLARFIPAINESSYWPYYTSRISGFAPQLGTTEGLERVSAGRNLTITPYVFGERAQYLNTPTYTSPDFKSQTELRAGADIKAIIHDSFTLDITVNPDFSQVETEDPQITINQRFEVYFPELRPFFLENAAYFQTPDNLFFSRTIQDPEFGARLTGRDGPWQVGFLGMDDRYPGNTLPSSDPNYGQHAANGVLRVQRDIGEESAIGLIATAYDFGAHHEYLASADARFRLSDNLVFTGQAVRSDTGIPALPKLSGADYLAALEYSGLHFEETTHYLESPRKPASRSQAPSRAENCSSEKWSRPPCAFIFPTRWPTSSQRQAALSEHLDAHEVVLLLNDFFTAMTEVILESGGTLDKYIGDCVMALFGAPIPAADDVQRAVQASIDMQRAAKIPIGVGLHTGRAVVGNIGSEQRLQYTAIGDTVNVAARLVSLALPGQIIVSEDIRNSAQGSFQALGEVELKGRKQKVSAYSLLWDHK